MLSVRFWGVRGSIPCPGPDTVIYGGNTSCLEIRADERLIIVDMGTGIRPLGAHLIAGDLKKYGKIEADIFVTHTHWDHIMGFPLFGPIYIPGTVLRITGPVSSESDMLESVIKEQLSYRYWPVRLSELAAKIEFNHVKETTLDLGSGLIVKTKFLNHPITCLGYRFEYKNKAIAAIFDHEPFHNVFSTDPSKQDFDEEAVMESRIAVAEENDKITRFIQDADIVIHDAQYSDEKYMRHVGWGHASCGHAVDYAVMAKAKKLIFYHHEPSHTDKQLKQIEKKYKKTPFIKVLMAREGMILEA